MRRALLAAAVVAAAPHARARAEVPRDAPTATDVDRADAPSGRSELGFDGGAPVEGWGVTLAGSWLEAPISFALPDGTTREPVRRRQTVRIGGALALGESAVIDARIAASRQLGDRLRGTGVERALERYVGHDVKLGARLRVLARPRFAVFVRGDLALPSGDAGDFAGDPGTSLAWRLIARATLGPGIVVAATAGLRLRGQEVAIADRLLGNETLAAAGLAVPLPPVRPIWCVDQLWLTAEASAIVGDDVGVARGPSPVELRAGVIGRPRPGWAIGVRIARGITDEIGSPSLRATLELTYQGSFQLLSISPEPDDAAE